jgi:SsrA-binding protein
VSGPRLPSFDPAAHPPRGPHGTRRRPKSPLGKKILATNRKARHDYAISHVVEAGLALAGSEVKSLRDGGSSLQDGYARIENGEAWLYGVHIPPLPQASYFNHEPRRKRKCLLHRKELRKLEDLLLGTGTTIVPLSLYFLGPRVKVELGVGRGKKQFDKREDIKRRDSDRELRRAMRRSGR